MKRSDKPHVRWLPHSAATFLFGRRVQRAALVVVAVCAMGLGVRIGGRQLHAWLCNDSSQSPDSEVLEVDVARTRLAKADGALWLASFKGITENAAREVSRFSGVVDLSGLPALTPGVAKHLAELPESCCLLLDGVESLPLDSAKSLVRFRGLQLWLGGLKELTPELAAVLAEYGSASPRGSLLRLTGVSHMSLSVLKEISRSKSLVLDIGGLQELDSDGAAALAQFRGRAIALNGLRSISAETCEVLRRFGGASLGLPGVRELSPAAARGLSRFGGEKLWLYGLEAPSDEVIALLRGFRGEVVLSEAVETSLNEKGIVEEKMETEPESSEG